MIDHWRINGVHYQKTLDAWLSILDLKQQKVKEILRRAYGVQKAESSVFDWRMFFLYSSEAFGFLNGSEWIVSQYLFSNPPLSSL